MGATGLTTASLTGRLLPPLLDPSIDHEREQPPAHTPTAGAGTAPGRRTLGCSSFFNSSTSHCFCYLCITLTFDFQCCRLRSKHQGPSSRGWPSGWRLKSASERPTQLAHQEQIGEMIAFLQSVGAQTDVALPATLLAPRQPPHVFTTPINNPVRKLKDTSKS